ncbi:nodulation protein NfeD [Paenibacillus rhizovicinus]|uniref:Nodulation protein NfeD n=1 Tax=Paenibacillus rhizovicinus TaxID=2704463 RepID=A0A6C0NWA8_9BACL|nr:NfeD family protein [Paenibacillus rhizovicinus]QHW30438.1 nodulation protein NfeD [Paenibacillus rhizovicinus]
MGQFGRRKLNWLLSVVMLAGFMFTGAAASAESASTDASAGSTVYVIDADRSVASGLYQHLKRAYDDAEEAKASRVLLVLNTLGGEVGSALDIGELIRESKIPTTAYVQGKAVSAGTYIALNAQQIVMEPGSTIGAAAVVDQNGTLIDNPKTVSYWTETMKSAAELNGRDPDIAAAMVNPSLKIELKALGRTKAAGEVLTLSAQEAVKAGYAEYTAATVDEALNGLHLDQPNIVHYESGVMEKIGDFLTNPVVMTILLIIGIAGVAIEFMVPGFGAPGIAGLLAFILYFFGHYVSGFAGFEDVALFIAGLLLLVSEFFIPSFGILGVLGAASLISGVLLAAPNPKSALLSLVAAVIIAAVIVFIVAKRFAHKGVWNKFILRDQLTNDKGYRSSVNKADYIGMHGVAVSPLRPAGTAKLGEARVDVVTRGEFIPLNAEIIVIQVEGTRVVVRQTNENE